MPGQWKAPAREAKCKPTAAEVVSAIESLYQDKVQPIGRILLKRVGERAAASAQAAAGLSVHHQGSNNDVVPCIDPHRLRKVCEKCDQLRVVRLEGGEYCALLVGLEDKFVDATDETDPYPEAMWTELALFFKGLESNDMFWPGGRFACAQALEKFGPPCLAYRSLGELCHIVQLAVSQRKILGYRDGYLVPYDYSLRMLKEKHALYRQPVGGTRQTGAEQLPYATWEEARSCIRSMLANSQTGAVPLPNVKRIFRSQFGMDLSETALGHSRLFELLQDPRLGDICTLSLQGNSKWAVVSPEFPQPAPTQPCASYRPELRPAQSIAQQLAQQRQPEVPWQGFSYAPEPFTVPAPSLNAFSSQGVQNRTRQQCSSSNKISRNGTRGGLEPPPLRHAMMQQEYALPRAAAYPPMGLREARMLMPIDVPPGLGFEEEKVHMDLEPQRVEIRQDYFIDDFFAARYAEKATCGDAADAGSADTTSAGSDGEAECVF